MKDSLTPTLPAASSWRSFCALRAARMIAPISDGLPTKCFIDISLNVRVFKGALDSKPVNLFDRMDFRRTAAQSAKIFLASESWRGQPWRTEKLHDQQDFAAVKAKKYGKKVPKSHNRGRIAYR
ncbi:hypothetical protein [Ralstonia pseudosolanacearum]|uniref:hypothetical protein n=1 Tax=Ralstonia pseudosolanacearum TaxID=1310165 RepID=UPI0018C86B72|nr:MULTISPECIES: hypothetical protein [Ralstonia]MDO3541821.1 hypothetical protein [Ralstonia pseudosolanacearum]UZF36901.1 hypothetical protein LGV81_13220 [Ralstonia sp. RS647]